MNDILIKYVEDDAFNYFEQGKFLEDDEGDYIRNTLNSAHFIHLYHELEQFVLGNMEPDAASPSEQSKEVMEIIDADSPQLETESSLQDMKEKLNTLAGEVESLKQQFNQSSLLENSTSATSVVGGCSEVLFG